MPFKEKEAQRLSAKKHYLKNSDAIKARANDFKKVARKRNREYVDNFLKEHPCIDCGESDIVVLEFDHIGTDKELELSLAVNQCWSLDKIKKEMKKCVVRCANCHRRITRKRRLERLS